MYAFMPATDATVSISLCSSGYDTKLIVYQSASDGQLLEVLCSDDYCNLQSWAEVGACTCHRAELLPRSHHICGGLECLVGGPASRMYIWPSHNSNCHSNWGPELITALTPGGLLQCLLAAAVGLLCSGPGCGSEVVLAVSQKWSWLCLRSGWSRMHAAMSPTYCSCPRKDNSVDPIQRTSPACAKLKLCDAARLQTALSANVLYYFVVDGFNGAAGTWAIDIEATDNSTVVGQLISGTYALAEYSAGGNSTNSEPACACCMLRGGQTACCACSACYVQCRAERGETKIGAPAAAASLAAE